MRTGVKARARLAGERSGVGHGLVHAVELQRQLERLKSNLRLAVIFGGDKSLPGGVVYPSNNTRSWKSYESVAHDIAASLRRSGFRHIYAMPEDMRLGDRLRRDGIHMAWLNSGGVQGYNCVAHAPATLEMLGLPYVGHDPLSATTLDNKHAFKREAVCAGLPTAPFSTWHPARGRFRPELNSRFQAAFGGYSGPFIVKPVSGRASLHVHVVEDKAVLADVIAEIYRATENVVLIEKYLPGREYCVAVAGTVRARQGRLLRGRGPFTFAALERVFAPHEKIFTSMDVRPITTDRFKPLDNCDAGLARRMRQLASQIFLEFNLGSLIRIDMRADEGGELHILEANPKPDLKQPGEGVTSLIAAGLPEAGMSYDDLILSLLADRMDYLFTHRRGAVQHIIELIPARSCAVRRTPVNDHSDIIADGAQPTAARRVRVSPGAAGAKSDARSVKALVSELAASASDINDLASAVHSSCHLLEHAQLRVASPDALRVGAEKIDKAAALLSEVVVEMNVLALTATVNAARSAKGCKAPCKVDVA